MTSVIVRFGSESAGSASACGCFQTRFIFCTFLWLCCLSAAAVHCSAAVLRLQCCSAAPACAGRDEDIKHDQNVKTDTK